MNVKHLLYLFEEFQRSDDQSDDFNLGAKEIARVKDHKYADTSVDFVRRFLESYPRYKDATVGDFLNELWHIRPNKPVPTIDSEMAPSHSKSMELKPDEFKKVAKREMTEPVLNFVYDDIKRYAGQQDIENKVPQEYANIISRIRQFLTHIKSATLGDLAEGVDEMLGRFQKTKDRYTNHSQKIQELDVNSLYYLPILLKHSDEMKGGETVLNEKKFRSNVKRSGGTDDTVDKIISVYSDNGILESSGKINTESVEQIKNGARELEGVIAKVVSDDEGTRLTDRYQAGQKVSSYKKLANFAKHIPEGVYKRTIPVVNDLIASKGFTRIHEVYNDNAFRNTPLGALYTALLVAQSARQYRALLHKLLGGKPAKGLFREWIGNRKKTNIFGSKEAQKYIKEDPGHPMVKVFKSVDIPY